MGRNQGPADLMEFAMVGGAILASQRVEFLLYGLISHLNERAKSEIKTFSNLDPESFLRGDVKDLKATLGQLVKGYGDMLLLTTEELD